MKTKIIIVVIIVIVVALFALGILDWRHWSSVARNKY
jgi:DNA-binding transcriptional regulator of glucitol operon